MLHEKRVILMTRLASYEQNEGKECMAIAKYFRSDYVTKHILLGILSATVTFVVCFILYVLYSLEELMESIYDIDLLEMARGLLWDYIVLVLVYCAILLCVSVIRYYLARRSLKVYYQNLKKLNALYEEKKNDSLA